MSLDESLRADLVAMEKAGTLKSFRHITGPMDTEVTMAEKAGRVLVLSSNNYLGLADHPEVVAAGKKALEEYGAGTASVRFICGTFSIHDEIEKALAKLSHTESALTYVSCWAANTGLIPAVAGADDALVSDELNHASLIDGCRGAKAKRLVYKHSDMKDLEAKLAEVKGARRLFVVTDGVFSMEGDIARLPDIVALARKYNAAIILDDSHGTGVMGKHGRGTHEHHNVMGRVDIITGTLGKALGGASGGYTSGRKEIIELLRQRSRPYLFSNSVAPMIVATSLKVLELLSESTALRDKLEANTKFFREGMSKLGFNIVPGSHPITPIMLGDAALAARFADAMLAKGVYVIGFSYPVVPKGKARIRTQISAAHSQEDLAFAIQAFAQVKREVGV